MTLSVRSSLLISTALSALAFAPAAFAQAQPAAAAGAGGDLLGEVVVTATKQTDTVSRVPLSVSASTQKSLDQQGIKNVVDLARSVPALTVSSANTSGVASFTIRGITTGGSAGAATVGVYLDDTNVTKRQVSGPGGSTNNNGSPLPALFDLERVEVLRGPQGTLYGGSSEGGTIRFITPTPSLTTYSTYDRASISSTKYGDPSYELGVAVGGPIIKDKLGMRIAVYGQRVGGYIDHVDMYQPQNVTWENSNKSTVGGVHLTALLRATDNFSAQFSLFMNQAKNSDGNGFNLPYNSTITTPTRCSAFTGYPVSGGAIPLVSCTAPARPITFTMPSRTYGPFNLGPFQTLTPNPSPSKSFSQIPTLTLQYDFPKMTVKSITSYFHDQSKSLNSDTSIVSSLSTGAAPPGCGGAAAAGTGAVAGCAITPANPNGNVPSVFFLQNSLGQPVQYMGQFKVNNERRGLTEELRFSSDNSGPFTWVGGAYYSYTSGKFTYVNDEDYNLAGLVFYGLTTGQRFAEINQDPSRGAVTGSCQTNSFPYLINAQGQQVPNPAGAGNGSCFPVQEKADETAAFRYQNLKDTEIAAFGEGSYMITNKLKAIAGLRLSRVQFTFYQNLYGVNQGYNNPTAFNQGVVQGTQTESPILPKVGLQYQIDDHNQVYVTASKGFRPGGVNTPVSAVLCIGLSQTGLTPQDIPPTYAADTVWSYEGGAKMRFFGNRLAVNTSAYRIDWSNVQVSIPTTGCGQTYNLNAGAARSEGFDLEAQAQLFRGFVLGLTAGYDNARYTTTTTGPKPLSGAAPTVVINAGDKLAVPPWTVNVSGQYNVDVTPTMQAYVRADYRFTSRYQNTASAGASGYAPDAFFNPEASNVNARIGIVAGPVDVNVFANNLFNSTDYLSATGGRTGCNVTTGAACTLYSTYSPFTTVTTFRPREIGLQVVYRH